MRLKVIPALAMCLLPAGLQGQTPQEIDRFLRAHYEEIPIPGFSAVVVKDGQIIFTGGYGVETLGDGTPITARTPLAIGSQTKSLTAVAVMQLVEQGRIDLDSPVGSYLPWFRTADNRGREITVRHLLTNTSGIPSTDRWLFSRDTTEASAETEARSLSLVPLVRRPGDSFEYANENWTLAGLVIREVSGLPYSAYMQQRIFDPMGMTRSSTALARLLEMDVPWGYFAGPDDTVVEARPRFIASALAAGSELRASAEDMGRFLIMMMQGGEYGGRRILSPESVETLLTPGVYTTMDLPDMGLFGIRAGYAMGWIEAQADGRTLILHGGNAIVMTSFTAFDPESRVGASLLYNGPELYAYAYPGKPWVVNNLLHLANGEPLSDFGLPGEADPTANEYDLPRELLPRYAGVYVSNEGRRFRIRVDEEGERLVLLFEAGEVRYERVVDFASEAGAVLRDLSTATLATFVLTPEGEVTGLVGMPGGTYRRLSEQELAMVERVRAPTGRVTFDLPRTWEATWVEERVTARADGETSWSVDGRLGREAWDESVTRMRRDHPSVDAAPERTETIGSHVWQQRFWVEGLGESARQFVLASTEQGGLRFSLLLTTPFGERTQAMRDVLVPLMTSVEFDAVIGAP